MAASSWSLNIRNGVTWSSEPLVFRAVAIEDWVHHESGPTRNVLGRRKVAPPTPDGTSA
jgi:hypothetical protein